MILNFLDSNLFGSNPLYTRRNLNVREIFRRYHRLLLYFLFQFTSCVYGENNFEIYEIWELWYSSFCTKIILPTWFFETLPRFHCKWRSLLKGNLFESFPWNTFEVLRIGNLFDFIELNVALLFLLSGNSNLSQCLILKQGNCV